MPTGRCDFDGETAELVPSHLAQIGARHARLGNIGERRDRPLALLAECFDEAGERRCDSHAASMRQPGLGRAAGRNDDVSGRHHRREGDDARHAAQRAVEAELREEREPVDGSRVELAVGHEHAHGDREVEARPPFAQTGRSQVDRDALQRPCEAARHHGAAHPVSGLAARSIGEPNDAEGRKPARNMDFDGDSVALDTEERGGRNGGEHEPSRCPRCAHNNDAWTHEGRHGHGTGWV